MALDYPVSKVGALGNLQPTRYSQPMVVGLSSLGRLRWGRARGCVCPHLTSHRKF